LARELLYNDTKEHLMNSETQHLTAKVAANFEADKKAFQDSMAKVQEQIDATTAEVNKLRAELKTQADEGKARTMARVTELTKDLDAVRKEQQARIEERLKQLHSSIQSINAELKHATAEGKAAAEAKAKLLREEYDSARHVLTASLEAELVEWKARISTAFDVTAEKKASATTALQAKGADVHAKHEAAQKKLHALKQANEAAFSELHRGVRAAIAEIETALQHARADIAAVK
jgi:regulator of replication initiation timing